MRVGASTLYGLYLKPSEAVRRLAEKNFRFIEVIFEHPHFLTRADVAALRKIKRDHALSFSMHCPFMTMQLGHKDAAVRRATRALLRRSLRAASALEATHYVLHGGRMQHVYASFGGDETEIFREFVGEVAPFVREAQHDGVRVVFENCLGHDFFARAENLFRAARACGAGFCLDIAHAELTRQKQALAKRVPDYVHATDTLLEQRDDLHLGIGDGSIDYEWWLRVLRRLEFDGSIILECAHEAAFQPSREKLLRMWKA
ncbi:MAG: sugar phosphate isomerase/epimerase family protein [Candidatus Norongarragalinales archaeon]